MFLFEIVSLVDPHANFSDNMAHIPIGSQSPYFLYRNW